MFATVVDTLDDDGLVDALRDSEQRRRQLEAEQATLIAELDRRRVYRNDGHASVRGLVRVLTARPTWEINDLIRTARLMTDHKPIATELREGSLGVAQAHLLASANAHPRCADQFGSVADILLHSALKLTYRELETVVARWINLADADGANQRAESSHANRNAYLHVSPNGFHAEANGTTIAGEAIKEIFDRFVQAEWDKDWAWTLEHHGNAACPALMPRTDRQRRFDAFQAVFETAVSTPPGSQPPEPVVNLICDPVTLGKILAACFGFQPDPDVDDLVPLEDRRCETANGVPVAPAEMLAALLAGHIRRVVLDPTSVVIDMGRRQRLFTGSARIAAHMGRTRCIWPGCEIPAARCQTDHITDWRHQGTTSPHDGEPCCPRHNLFKQNHGYTITRHPDGTIHAYRPDDTEVA